MNTQLQELFQKQASIENVRFSWEGMLYSFSICREDALHPEISGNKLRKLFGHLQTYFSDNFEGIVSVGGAFSNHLLALAKACSIANIPLVCIIRGEKPRQFAYTLQQLTAYGAQLVFVNRAQFRQIREEGLNAVFTDKYSAYLFIPEGGGGLNGTTGFNTIDYKSWAAFDAIICAGGTGVSALGLAQYSAKRVYAFSVLKGAFLAEEIKNVLAEKPFPTNLQYVNNHTTPNGYAKVNDQLFLFIEEFYKQTGIALDPIYTGKVILAALQYFKEKPLAWWQSTLFYHSGGLQGIAGFKEQMVFLRHSYPQFFVD